MAAARLYPGAQQGVNALAWCRSFRRAAAEYEELYPDVVDKLLKVLSAGASLSFIEHFDQLS